jgi:transposase
MAQVTTIGLDIAKHVFQAHGADAAGQVLFRKRVSRGSSSAFSRHSRPASSRMEARAGAHYWAREISKLAHSVRLMAPACVEPFVERQKNDAADAEAVCEAVQ